MTKTVLVVDDSSTIRAQISRALGAAGFEVLLAADGEEGAALLAERAVSLVICDVNMPRLDGLSMLERVRRAPCAFRGPVLILTSEGEARLMRRAKDAGAQGWVVKPLLPERLVDLARKLTGVSSAPAAEPAGAR